MQIPIARIPKAAASPPVAALRRGDRDGHRADGRFLVERLERSDDRLGAARLRALVERPRERDPEEEREGETDDDQEHPPNPVATAAPVADHGS